MAPKIHFSRKTLLVHPLPKPSFHPKHSCPTECREVGKAVHELFWCFFGRFPLVLLVVTIYHWIEKILLIKTLENLLRLLLSNLVRIKKHVFVHVQKKHVFVINTYLQSQHCWFWLNTLSHLCAILLGFQP